MRRFIALIACAGLAGVALARDFTLTILHQNDLHARLEPTIIQGQPYGGVARVGLLVDRLRSTEPNTILLNAGDTFQGTLYFNAYSGLADLWFLNRMGVQAMALGNHEFDKGPTPLAEFARRAKFPLLAANLDLSSEPSLRDLVRPHTILEIGRERVGVIGAITEDTPSISAPGPTVKFLPVRESVQSSIRALKAQGIDKIILLSHLGYSEDLRVAGQIAEIDVIVGGHSHTLLGAIERPGFPTPGGTYPTVARGPGGTTVLVVQAWEWGKVLGKLRVTFDDRGRVRSFAGSQPLVVDKDIPEDPFLKEIVERFQRPIDAMRRSVIGQATAHFDGSRGSAATGRNTMGSVVADAALAATANAQTVAAFVNAGGVRASLEAGPITFEGAITVQPFGNTLTVLELTGAELLAALEHGVSRLPDSGGGILLPSAGFTYSIDLAKLPGQRVTGAELGGTPIDPAKTYRIAVNTFTAKGGDGHTVLATAPGFRIDTGLLDVDALVAYIRVHSPLTPHEQPRMLFVAP